MKAPFAAVPSGYQQSLSRRWTREWCAAVFLVLFASGPLVAQVQIAGTLYVDLRATNASAGSATWINQGTLGNFTETNAPFLETNVAGTSVPGVSFDGIADAYQGPNAVADIEVASDRSIEVWAYNPSLPAEETMVSLGHRNSNRREVAFNFGTSGSFGAVTHFGDDISWGVAAPSANAWHHLAYTYSNTVARVYLDGALVNSKTLVAALNTFTNEPINLACQRGTSNGVRSQLYSGYLNTVRIHGGVLSDSQIQSNFLLGPIGGPTNPPPAPGGLVATVDYSQVFLEWNAANGANRYTVKRGTASGGPYTNIAVNITTRSYFDSPLTPGGTYYYVVSAGNVFGDSTNSSPVSATTGVRHTVDGLIHRWSFSETNGTTLEDTGGNADGQVIPLTGDYVLGGGKLRLFGGAKGTADYAEMPSGLLGGLSNVTVEAWATPWSAQNWARLFDFGSGSGITGTSFFLSLCRAASLNVQRLEFIPFTVDTGLPTTPGQQYHYVAIWGATNGAGGAGRMEWYRDGVFAGGMDTGPTTVASVDDTVLWLGRSQYPDNTADADFNDVRLYNRVLTPAEINFNRANGPDTVYVTPPVAVNDAMTLNPGAKALIPVLQNDLGSAIDPNSTTIVTPPSSGTAQVKPGGKILYTHNGGLTTSDQFTYRIASAGGATSGVATVSLTISSALRLPNTTMTVPNTPPPLGYQVVDAFTNNPVFEDALALRTPPGNSNQLFVAERRGIISYVDVTSPNPVRQVLLDISNQVMFDNGGEGEMGLLGFDFHPGFATNGYFFVAYTALGPRQDRLSRFTANPVTLTVDTNTQQILFSVVDEQFNHNGSDVHFGPDGYLYMSMGDEGDWYNRQQNAQRIDKDFYSGLLRIDVDRKPGNVEPNPHSAIPTNGSGQAFYKIPINNPYVHTSLGGTWNGIYFGQTITNLGAVRGEFFATGLRHPWRFWIDPTNSEIWVGDVGQDRYEEVNIVTNGGNYGWAYYEGTTLARSLYPTEPNLPTNPPPGLTFALYTYSHTGQPGDPQLAGNAVIGGVIYRGNRLPEINGAYVFGDFPVGGASTIWALRRTNSSVVVQRLASDQGIAAFGIDPSNGDLLVAAYGQNKVKRLVRGDVSNSTFPQKLSDTGVFADFATLSPNPGIVNYEPVVAFWSDYAIKRRWFCIPDVTNTVTFATDANWSFPPGMKWIKHFDLELERGNPATKKRIETRLLVKTAADAFGVSYAWNDAGTEAFLVPEAGTNFFLPILVGGVTNQQQVEIPSRTACLVCHTPVGGHALSFNTRELNQAASLNGFNGNQLTLLGQAGYLNTLVSSPQTLPAHAHATNANLSLESRVRSYFAVNCVQCHQPGGSGPSTWDARPQLTLEQTHLINTTLLDNGGNPTNKVIVPGDLVHSVLWQRLQGSNGFGRMPPLATHTLDQPSINLVTSWIAGELTNRQSFAQWQLANFGSTNAPNAAMSADPDGDGANNYYEYLTGTPPLLSVPPPWTIEIDEAAGTVGVSFLRVANRAFLVETSTNFTNWSVWNVPGNQLYFGASNQMATVTGPLIGSETNRFFRVKVFEP